MPNIDSKNAGVGTVADHIHQVQISNETKKRIIEKAVLTRKVEECLLDLYSQNKLNGTIHTCIGEEFSGAVISEFLEQGDTIFSNHRCHGHFLSFTNDVKGLIAEIMGKESGVCGGRGGSQHLCKDGFYSNGIQGGIVPVATGLALAHKFNKKGKISVVFIGDGTLGEGVIYESLNISSKWNLPILVVLENNGYSQSTEQKETLAGDICSRASSFGIRTFKGDTWDWEKLYGVAGEAIHYVRKEAKPAFLQVDTYRLKAHSKGDDIRPRNVVEPYEKRDPINILAVQNSREFVQLNEEVTRIVEQAVLEAESAPDTNEILYSTPDNTPVTSWTEISLSNKRMVKAINEAFNELMNEHNNMLFIGEDVKSPYGGAFKVSQGLSDLYPDRVLNTPISEAAIVGIGCGLAMEGYKPFIEIMFGDFLTLGLDQILNHATKFRYMYNDQVKANMVVRTPMGGGRGYGPTHSQTLDRHFMGIPGLRIVALNNLVDPAKLYRSIVDTSEDCTLVIENKQLYAQFLREKLPMGYRAFTSDERYPSLLVKPEAKNIDVTIVSYGGLTDMLITVLDRLFEEHDIIGQLICPTQIYPFDFKPFMKELENNHLLAIVEEGQGFAGFGAEVIAQIAEVKPALLHKVKRIAALPTSIPAAGHLEKNVLPNMESIISTIREGCQNETRNHS